jgi:hypothetical protein
VLVEGRSASVHYAGGFGRLSRKPGLSSLVEAHSQARFFGNQELEAPSESLTVDGVSGDEDSGNPNGCQCAVRSRK